MGTESFWVPAIVSALGATASVVSTRNAAKKQDQIAAAGIRRQAGLQRDADAQAAQAIAARGRSNPEAERAAAMEGFMQQLRAARGSEAGSVPPITGSDRFQTDLAGVAPGIQNFGTQKADIMSRIAAPERQRQREGIEEARVASGLGNIGRRSSGEDFLTQLRARAVQPDLALQAFGSLMQGVASGLSSRAEATGSIRRPPPPTPRGSTPLMQLPGGFDPSIYG